MDTVSVNSWTARLSAEPDSNGNTTSCDLPRLISRYQCRTAMACFDNEFDGNPRIFPCVAQASACEASMAVTLLVLCAEHCLIAAFSLAETALVIGGPKLCFM